MTAQRRAAETVALADTAIASAVLNVGLDRFDHFSEVFGPAIADQVLHTTAQRLSRVAPPGCRIERAGAAEFLVICPPGTGAGRLAAQVLAVVQRSVAVEGGEVHVTASVGVATADDGPADLDGLTADAYTARRTATRGGGAQIVVDRPEMRHDAARRLTLGAELGRAVDRDELVLHYQPTWNPKTLQVVGVEALVRWNHPTRGLLAPEEFIPLAEQSGLIVPVGRWVLAHAIGQLDEWCRDRNLATDRLVMAVNLSVRQLHDPGLLHDVRRLLDGVAFAPSQLCLEITETVVMQEVDTERATLSGLRRLGVRLAIDDFGTGFSSLAVLRQLPVDLLKIDRSFVHNLAADPANRQVVRAIVELAHGFGLDVVAEGVETPTDLDAVRALACDVVQGFGLARPTAAGEVVALLERSLPQTVRAIWFGQGGWSGSPAPVPALWAGTP